MNPPLDKMLYDIAQSYAHVMPTNADTIMAASKALTQADELLLLIHDLMNYPTIAGETPQRTALITNIKAKLYVWNVNYGL